MKKRKGESRLIICLVLLLASAAIILSVPKGEIIDKFNVNGVCKEIIWSPDGNKIIYVQSINNEKEEIWVMNIKTRHKKFVTSTYSRPSNIFWAPDSQKILLTITDTPSSNIEEMRRFYLPKRNIYIFNDETGELKQLIPPGHSNISTIFSPNGKKIVYSSTEGCSYKVKLKSGKEVMKWAYGLYVMNTDGSNRKKLTNPRFTHCEDIPIGWKKDGKKIIYVAQGFERTDTGIYTINVDGTENNLLVEGIWWKVSLSPNGDKIAYIGKDDEICVVDITSRKEKKIIFDRVEKHNIQWISDNEIVFEVRGKNTSLLKLLNLETQKIEDILKDYKIKSFNSCRSNRKIAFCEDKNIQIILVSNGK